MAGPLLGAALSGIEGRIIGISAGDKTERVIQRVRTPQLAAAEMIGASSEVVGQMPVMIDDRFLGQGYGIPIVGGEAMKFGGWQRLNAEYAKQFGVEAPSSWIKQSLEANGSHGLFPFFHGAMRGKALRRVRSQRRR
jgi:hypothetical protein